MNQAHQPHGWKQAGAEILRNLRVPRGIYRMEAPPPAKASDYDITRRCETGLLLSDYRVLLSKPPDQTNLVPYIGYTRGWMGQI